MEVRGIGVNPNCCKSQLPYTRSGLGEKWCEIRAILKAVPPMAIHIWFKDERKMHIALNLGRERTVYLTYSMGRKWPLSNCLELREETNGICCAYCSLAALSRPISMRSQKSSIDRVIYSVGPIPHYLRAALPLEPTEVIPIRPTSMHDRST